MPVANINGANLNYELAGQGNAVVLLHGYSGSSQDWANQVSALSPKYKVAALDQRGHGKSAAPDKGEEYSVPIFANDVFSLLGRLNIERCCLAGHSLGGAIALYFALEYQDMLAGLVLVDTASEFPITPAVVEQKNKLNEIAHSQGMEAAFEYDVANNPERIELFRKHPEQKGRARRKILSLTVDTYIYTWKVIEKWKIPTSRLSEITVPTLIYWGDEDVGLADAAQTLKKGIANSKLIMVKGVGHSPHEDAPEVFNKALLDFVSKIKW